jgi:protocatechuate 4,5-dioxygenase beta chain
MWLIARGAMSDLRDEGLEAKRGGAPREIHRFHHVPASNTSVGHLILENS